MREEYITEEEQQEYLAYKSPQDFLDNLTKGIDELDHLSDMVCEQKILLCGGMVAFDKGLSNYLNHWYRRQPDLFLLSEVTAQYRRYTDERIRMPHICTPHLLAKEMVLQEMPIPLTREMTALSLEKSYVADAIFNLQERHVHLGDGYAEAWCYYAYEYAKKLLAILKPKCVILWNEFYAFHMIIQGICMEMHIPLYYMEFGCLPGTLCIESGGQQGESRVATRYQSFKRKPVTKAEISQAKRVLDFLYATKLNRNVQPQAVLSRQGLHHYQTGRPVVLYMGQNDYESGMCPYNRRTQKYHSPVFQSSLQALEFLTLVCIQKGWNLVYKPHPVMDALGHRGHDKEDQIDVVSDVDVNSCIDCADVVVTILSQAAYVALIRNKPAVMLGYTQLRGKNCTYEAFSQSRVSKVIQKALKQGFTKKQKKNFQRHAAQLLKYYLYDDLVERDLRFGRRVEEIELGE
jgi:hypothetical protein